MELSAEAVRSQLSGLLNLTNALALRMNNTQFAKIREVLLEFSELVCDSVFTRHIPLIAEISNMFGPNEKRRLRNFTILLSCFGSSVQDLKEAAASVMEPDDDPTNLDNLFSMLTRDSGQNTVDFDGFIEATKHLNLPVSTEKRLQVFVECDAGLNGALDKETFKDAIAQVGTDLTLEVMASMRLDPMSLIYKLLYLAMVVLCLLVFMLLAIMAFTEGSAFESVINSAFVALTGLSLARNEDTSESLGDPEVLDKQVKAVIELWGGDEDDRDED